MQDIVTKAGTWLVIAMLGYVLASMQDRYTGSQAKHDKEIMRQYVRETMQHHVDRGPHNDIGARVAVLESRMGDILAELKSIKRILDDEDK